MLQDYFAVGAAIEQRLRDEVGNDVDSICSLFTVNDPELLKRQAVSLHITQLPSTFGNDSGNGVKQAETQRWQVSLCFKSPRSDEEVAVMRERAGVLCLRVRKALQGFCPPDAKPLRVTANTPILTDDCRFRIFAFTFECVCIV
ncbi:phage tail terminator protein [Wielerella bovis]|uniref:phage tail terminator protein n=1 Tax=Wielerella bovis TaxID=2917790 RepID=UPI0020193D4F|nr:hypothetical protein [Wielerella bovis]ULJ65938.1 hypothetical protein MIS31_06550 [Wielerella bovis]